jgi:alcohol dehydrogenase, propanol-preferring
MLSALTPDSVVVMIGIGGLGHMSVKILRAVSAASLVATDMNKTKLEFARKHREGATVNTRSENAAEEILAASGSWKVKAVFDFIGIQSTIDLAVRVHGYDSQLAIVGLGGGVMSFSPGTAAGCVPRGCSVTAPFGGTRPDFMEVVALAGAGMIEAEKTCLAWGPVGHMMEMCKMGMKQCLDKIDCDLCQSLTIHGCKT